MIQQPSKSNAAKRDSASTEKLATRRHMEEVIFYTILPPLYTVLPLLSNFRQIRLSIQGFSMPCPCSSSHYLLLETLKYLKAPNGSESFVSLLGLQGI